MSIIHKYILSFVRFSAISLIFTIPLISQNETKNNLDKIWSFTKSLEEKSDFDHAITEYLKIICFADKKETRAEAYFRIGICSRELGLWNKTHEAFQKTLLLSESDSLKILCKLTDATILIAEGQYDKAQINILMMMYLIPAAFKEQAVMILITSSIVQYDFKKTKKFLDDFGSSIDNKVLLKKMDSILIIINQHETKSASTAKWFSTFLPGLGQFYAGDYRNSANAFLLNAMNFSATCLYIYYGEYGNALLYFAFLTERYYSGNRFQAEQSVIKFENSFAKENAKKLLEIIRIENTKVQPLNF
ncbi:MAG: hypothetical protein V1779_16695 [bacterium]